VRDPPRSRPGRRLLPRPVGGPGPAAPDRVDAARRGGRRRRLRAHRGVRGAGRVVAPLGRGRLLPRPARLRLPRPGRPAGELRLNTSHGLYRRLISTFISPLAAAYMLVVALLLAPRRRLAAVLAVPIFAGLLWTVSRSALAGLAVGLVVLALARKVRWPLPAAALAVGLGIAFASVFTSIAPKTHFFKADLAYQEAYAKAHPGAKLRVLSPSEPSIKSHLTNLRDGLKTVGEHPQGYG